MSFVRAVFTSQLTIESEMDEEILSLQKYHEEEIISLKMFHEKVVKLLEDGLKKGYEAYKELCTMCQRQISELESSLATQETLVAKQKEEICQLLSEKEELERRVEALNSEEGILRL